MRVHLQSSLPIVCPFDFIIMKTLASKPATGVLYENFWIVYDEKSFNSCAINMTYYKDGNPKDRNRKLLECDSPEALKSFTYSIDFKAKTPANSGISFVGGEYYYFLGKCVHYQYPSTIVVLGQLLFTQLQVLGF